jgi:FtsP/CotA-like multicopper oxidase with cupredoxin domain
LTIPGPLIRAHVGDRVIVHFTNDLPQPSTIHWHGVRVPIEMDGVPEISQPEVKRGETFTYDFVVRDAGVYWYHPHVNLRPLHPMAWKDTLNVPMEGTIRFLVVFDERPGMWMFHCHILDHADGGLMGHVHLAPQHEVGSALPKEPD